MSLDGAGGTRMFARSRSIVECDARLYLPEWSEYVGAGRVRHLWHCEQCDVLFETITRFEAAAMKEEAA